MTDQPLEYVGFWVRLVASVIDSVLAMIIVAPALFAIYGREYLSNTTLFAGPADFLLQIVLPAIAVIVFWIARQSTPGKMAFSARIVDAATGGKPSNAQLIGRYFAYYISIIPCGLGFLWIAFDARKQGWHDKLAGTVVIRNAPRHGPEPVRFGPG